MRERTSGSQPWFHPRCRRVCGAGVRRWSTPLEERLPRVPGGAVTLVLAAAGYGRECLQGNAVRKRRGDVGVVVGRAHLDDVDADDGQLQADPADRVEELARGQPARLRGARARGVPRVADVDVDREEDSVALVGGDPKGLGEALRQTAVDDL